MSKALKKLSHFITSTAINFQRQRPHVQVLYLNRKRKFLNPGLAKEFRVEGHVLDEVEGQRKVQKIGNSFYVSHPEGWLDSVAREGKGGKEVDSCLVLTSNNEKLIVISTPKTTEEVKR